MDKKNKTYIVVLMVIGLWGYVFYVVYDKFFKKNEVAPQVKVATVAIEKKVNMKDTFSIIADYRDPFLGKIVSSEAPKVVRLVTSTKPAPVVNKAPWPALAYKGMIKNQKNKQLAILMINGKSTMLSLGEIAYDVEIKKIYNDSVEVLFQKEKKIVKK